MSPGARETRAFASEVKFLLPHATGLAVREWARQHLERDPHGTGPFGDEYRTSTIYLDTPEYDVFFRRGSFGRAKYRIRRYADSSGVFLERKLRRPGMLTKRRTFIEEAALSRLERADSGGWAGDWFRRRVTVRRLRPVCQIAYSRVARAGMAPSGPIRLTLDERLHAMPATRPVFGVAGVTINVADEYMILELKFRADVPALFKELVELFRLTPQATSKYRLGLAAVEPTHTSRSAALVATQAAIAAIRPV